MVGVAMVRHEQEFTAATAFLDRRYRFPANVALVITGAGLLGTAVMTSRGIRFFDAPLEAVSLIRVLLPIRRETTENLIRLTALRGARTFGVRRR